MSNVPFQQQGKYFITYLEAQEEKLEAAVPGSRTELRLKGSLSTRHQPIRYCLVLVPICNESCPFRKLLKKQPFAQFIYLAFTGKCCQQLRINLYLLLKVSKKDTQ
jgi:hypothetical protein